MKNSKTMILLSAGVLLALAGCQKGIENEKNLVRFKATSTTTATRTAYAEGEDAVSGGVQRIDWKSGDQILIWSDKAVDRLGSGKKSSKYSIGTVSTSGVQSIADVSDPAGTGLTWTEGETSFKFSGSYGNFTTTDGENGYPVSVSATVPASQAINEGYPDMNNAFMLARPVSVASQTAVELLFDPYFTAFELNVASRDEIKIKSVTLKSEKRTNGANTFGPSTVSGPFSAAMNLASDNAWVVTVPEVTDANAQTVATFATPLELKKSAATDEKTGEVKLVIFAVPQEITSLTMNFEVENSAGVTEHRHASIIYAKDGTNYAAGDPVTFAGRKKHNIKGLVLDSIHKDIELVLKVIPWADETGEVNYVNEEGTSGDAIANAVALEFASGAAVTSGGARRRNNYFANGTDPIHAYFSVFAPVGGTWKIKISGDTDKFTVTGPDGSTTSSDGTEITGSIGSRVDFQIARNGATASNSIQINFLVVTADGREFSINSEVTRANALTITGQVAN